MALMPARGLSVPAERPSNEGSCACAYVVVVSSSERVDSAYAAGRSVDGIVARGCRRADARSSDGEFLCHAQFGNGSERVRVEVAVRGYVSMIIVKTSRA